MSVRVISGDQGEFPPPRWEEVGFAAAVAGHESEFPLLARSLQDVRAAATTRVEWLMQSGHDVATWFNWTQIIRTPFGVTSVGIASKLYGGVSLWERTRRQMLARHLGEVETTIRDGRLFRQINYYLDEETGEWYPVEIKGMGGAKFYLRRDPNPDDYIGLRLLRDCAYIDRTMPDIDGRNGEFISEISLEVRPAVLAVAA